MFSIRYCKKNENIIKYENIIKTAAVPKQQKKKTTELTESFQISFCLSVTQHCHMVDADTNVHIRKHKSKYKI